MTQVTTVTFFRFSTFRDKYWALSQMHYAHKPLKAAQGQLFYKLLASGRGDGFSILPDFSVSCLLQVWESREAAAQFFARSELLADYTARCSEKWTLYLKCSSVKGKWSGKEPFTEDKTFSTEGMPVAVITRASVKLKSRFSFWRFVPQSHPDIHSLKGLIYMKGLGDIPIAKMVTFSAWDTLEDMIAFAHHSEHSFAIHKAMQKGWFKEALFARFVVVNSEGSWAGKKTISVFTPPLTSR